MFEENNMRYTIYYDKTLKMTPEKLASQVAHVTLNLGYRLGEDAGQEFGSDLTLAGMMGEEFYYKVSEEVPVFKPEEQTIIVLGLSHTKFKEKLQSLEKSNSKGRYHVQTDLGLTEVKAGTITAFVFIS